LKGRAPPRGAAGKWGNAMTDRKPGFWHDIARQAERDANVKPMTDAEFNELVRRRRRNVQLLRKLADDLDNRGTTKS
jgi:hypothetical protein